MPVLPDDINFSMSGTSSVNDTTVLPNQVITFTHNLRNNGPTGSNPIDWGTWGGPSSSGPWSLVASGNAGTFSAGQTKPVGTENYTVPAGAVPTSQIPAVPSALPGSAVPALPATPATVLTNPICVIFRIVRLPHSVT